MRKLFSTIIIALFLIPGSAVASHDNRPAPPEGYPYCHDDPDVSCYEPPGYDVPDTTYPSEQYPDGWYDDRYNDDGTPNEFRRCELAGGCAEEPIYPQPTDDPGGFEETDPGHRPDDERRRKQRKALTPEQVFDELIKELFARRW